MHRFVQRHEVAWELLFAGLAIVFVALGFVEPVDSAELNTVMAAEWAITGVFAVEFHPPAVGPPGVAQVTLVTATGAFGSLPAAVLGRPDAVLGSIAARDDPTAPWTVVARFRPSLIRRLRDATVGPPVRLPW